MPSLGAHKNRVFFALWPNAVVQAQLARYGEELSERLGGKPTQQALIHLTLVFLGEVSAVEQLHALAREVQFEPFVLSIDRAGCWSHNKVAWLAPQTVPVPLVSLVAQLEKLLAFGESRKGTDAYLVTTAVPPLEKQKTYRVAMTDYLARAEGFRDFFLTFDSIGLRVRDEVRKRLTLSLQ